MAFRVMGPEGYLEEQRETGRHFQMLTPLRRRVPPELAWKGGRLFGDEVLPALG